MNWVTHWRWVNLMLKPNETVKDLGKETLIPMVNGIVKVMVIMTVKRNRLSWVKR
jgi:hypothetical protein